MSAINPRVILVTTNAFGQTGPDAHKVGFDGIGQAMSGAVFMSGDPDAPRRASVTYVDFGTAISAAFGAMLALMARERTGRGQEVSGSLMATALTFSNAVLIEQAISKPDRVPQGNLGYGSAPADLFKCSDGRWLMVQVVGQPLWEKFCRMLGAEDWLADPRFKDDLGRGKHARVVSERLGAWCAARSRADALKAFEAARVPAGPVHSPQEALDDAHIRASGILREIAYPGSPHPRASGGYADPAVGNARRDPRPRADAGRARRGNSRRNRLFGGGDRAFARRPHRLKAQRKPARLPFVALCCTICLQYPYSKRDDVAVFN